MQITPRDKKILQVTGIALPLLLLVYFFLLRPNGGEDVALLSGPTGITGSTGVPAESPSVCWTMGVVSSSLNTWRATASRPRV